MFIASTFDLTTETLSQTLVRLLYHFFETPLWRFGASACRLRCTFPYPTIMYHLSVPSTAGPMHLIASRLMESLSVRKLYSYSHDLSDIRSFCHQSLQVRS